MHYMYNSGLLRRSETHGQYIVRLLNGRLLNYLNKAITNTNAKLGVFNQGCHKEKRLPRFEDVQNTGISASSPYMYHASQPVHVREGRMRCQIITP